MVAYHDLERLCQSLGRALVRFCYLLFGLEIGYLIQLLQRHGCWQFLQGE